MFGLFGVPPFTGRPALSHAPAIDEKHGHAERQHRHSGADANEEAVEEELM